MVNEERIKLMTRMASYEKDEYRKNQKIVCFFKSDYISMQMLKSAVASTIAFAMLFGLYILYDFELFMKDIYKMDMFDFIKNVIIIYLFYVSAVLVFTYVASLYRYNKALHSTKLYYGNLRKLSQIYNQKEERPKG